jgi:hypothetical protein
MSKRKRSPHQKQMAFFTILFGLLGVLAVTALLWLMNAGCRVVR